MIRVKHTFPSNPSLALPERSINVLLSPYQFDLIRSIGRGGTPHLPTEARRPVNALIRRGFVARDGHGRYELTTDGTMVLHAIKIQDGRRDL